MTAPTGVRNYSNTATEATLTASVGATDTSLPLSAVTGDPTPPFTAALARGTANEEIVLVTALIGTTATVTRGFDGTSAKAQSAGTTVQEVVVALDFREANNHINTQGAVHGVTSQLVGIDDVQTLSNKTLQFPTLVSPQITGTMSTQTINATSVAATSVSSSGPVTAAGAVHGAQLLTDADVVLPQLAADPGLPSAANAVSLFKRDDHGLYVLGTTGRRRLTVHWGSATSYPATALAGDTVFRTDLYCTMRTTAAGWEQATVAVGTAANRAGIATGSLLEGFRFHESDTDRDYEWGGTSWRYVGGGVPSMTALTVSGGFTAAVGREPAVYLDSSGRVCLEGWFTASSSYTPNGTQVPITLGTGLRPTGGNSVHWVPYAGGGGAGGVIISIRPTGAISVDSNPAGPATVPSGASHFLDGISFHPAFNGGSLA